MKRLLHGDRLWLLGILLAAVAAFEPALLNTYTFDDPAQTEALAVPHGLAGWAHAAAAPWWPPERLKNLWRPLTRLSILAQKALFGSEGRPFYALNILLHAAASLLLFRLGRRLGLGARAAGLGALLFAVHPIHAEAVHQVVGRAETLAACWMLAGLLLYLRYGLRDWRCWLLQPLCFALALGSKEHALLYPGLLALVMLVEGQMKIGQHTTHHKQQTYAACAMLGVLMLVLGLFLAGKAAATGGLLEARSSVPYYENPLAQMSLGRRLPAVLGIFGYAASRLVWPAGLAPDYSAVSFPFERGWGWGWSWAGLGLLVFVVVWAVRNGRRGGRGWALAAAALGSYGLIGNGPFTIGTVMAQRLWYWPSAPACLGLGWALATLGARLAPERRPLGALALTALILALIGAAWGDAPAWRSPEDFAAATLARFPQNWRANTEMARLCYQPPNPDFERGLAYARRAAEILPGQAMGWAWVGANAMFLAGRQDEAAAAFARALELDPNLYEAHHQWGNLLESQGRRAEAARQLREYLKAPALPGAERAKIQARLARLERGN